MGLITRVSLSGLADVPGPVVTGTITDWVGILTRRQNLRVLGLWGLVETP